MSSSLPLSPPPAPLLSPQHAAPQAAPRLPQLPSPQWCGKPRGTVWLSGGCCGLVTAGFVYALLLLGSVGLLALLDVPGRPLHVFLWLGLNALEAMALWAHLTTMLTDPGAVPRDVVPTTPSAGETYRLCHRCESYKPPRAHHCSICKRCILKVRPRTRRSLARLTRACARACVELRWTTTVRG